MAEDLFGYDLVQASIERIKDAYRFSQSLGLGKLWVAFSGGKDSICIYYLCKMASEQLGVDDVGEYHYNVTNIDPPELVKFIKTFNDVHMDLPKKTFWELIVNHNMPPTRMIRYCCQELKERGGNGRFCVTGVRWAESTRRKNTRGAFEDFGRTKEEGRILNADNDEDRRELEHCIPKQKYVCNPIVNWSDDDVWHFIKSNNLPYCSLYDKGWTRIGCLACPNATARERDRQLNAYPKYREQYLRTFKKMIDKRKAKGLPCDEKFETPESCLYWWVHGDEYKCKRKIQ